MSLCALAFALLLGLFGMGAFSDKPVLAYMLIWAGAALWACLMWNEAEDPATEAQEGRQPHPLPPFRNPGQGEGEV